MSLRSSSFWAVELVTKVLTSAEVSWMSAAIWSTFLLSPGMASVEDSVSESTVRREDELGGHKLGPTEEATEIVEGAKCT